MFKFIKEVAERQMYIGSDLREDRDIQEKLQALDLKLKKAALDARTEDRIRRARTGEMMEQYTLG